MEGHVWMYDNHEQVDRVRPQPTAEFAYNNRSQGIPLLLHVHTACVLEWTTRSSSATEMIRHHEEVTHVLRARVQEAAKISA